MQSFLGAKVKKIIDLCKLFRILDEIFGNETKILYLCITKKNAFSDALKVMPTPGLIPQEIYEAAREIGFDACAITAAKRLDEDAEYMEAWVQQGLHGEMSYLERNQEKRYDIRKLVPGGKWVIVCLLRYEKCGHDYHRTIKSKLYELEARLGNKPLETQHIFCDSAPVLERGWAVEAGLGFIGKNRQLIHPELGSRVHIGELVIGDCLHDVDSIDKPTIISNCGACTKCIESCVHSALGQARWDATKCLAYTTHKCEVCQQVCPYNTKETP